VEKNPRSLRSHWSFSAHRVFRHAGTDVRPFFSFFFSWITLISNDIFTWGNYNSKLISVSLIGILLERRI
jgi:hypothetical protein